MTQLDPFIGLMLDIVQPAKRGRGKAQKTLTLVRAAHDALAAIQPASVRAVCYKLFTRALIANMSKAETDKVSKQLTWARNVGIIPWDWIVDRESEAQGAHAWENPDAYVETVKRAYRRDRWQDQPSWLEVWSEKATVRGTLAPVLDAYGVKVRYLGGYSSTTVVHEAAVATVDAKRELTALYVGDWDPSGLHMSEADLPTRLTRYGGRVEITRLALTPADIGPTLPSFSVETKKGDPRYRWFRDRYGTRCWELDALDPNMLRDRVERAIRDRLDPVKWEQAAVTEAAEVESLQTVLAAWPTISRQASKYDRGQP